MLFALIQPQTGTFPSAARPEFMGPKRTESGSSNVFRTLSCTRVISAVLNCGKAKFAGSGLSLQAASRSAVKLIVTPMFTKATQLLTKVTQLRNPQLHHHAAEDR